MRFSLVAASLACVLGSVSALSPAQWRSQSIYQIVTDRFVCHFNILLFFHPLTCLQARTDGSTSASCNTGSGVYCGGTFQGIINKLDYIQGMGFTAVSYSMERCSKIKDN